MALEKQRTYMVLNYSSSPVSLTTKDRSYILEGGTREQPYVLPLTIEEINTANTTGTAFKHGCAFFEPEFQEDIYSELRMQNWESILRDEQIEDIILNPTKEGLEQLIAIDHEMYFGRVYGIYMGLKSVFAEISPRVALVIEQRREELKVNQRKTEIIISKPASITSATGEDVAELKARLAKMEELMLTREKQAQVESFTDADANSNLDKSEVPEVTPRKTETPTPLVKKPAKKK